MSAPAVISAANAAASLEAAVGNGKMRNLTENFDGQDNFGVPANLKCVARLLACSDAAQQDDLDRLRPHPGRGPQHRLPQRCGQERPQLRRILPQRLERQHQGRRGLLVVVVIFRSFDVQILSHARLLTTLLFTSGQQCCEPDSQPDVASLGACAGFGDNRQRDRNAAI